jgi:hypothetical protein
MLKVVWAKPEVQKIPVHGPRPATTGFSNASQKRMKALRLSIAVF